MPWPLLPHPFHYLIRFLDVSLRRTQIHVRACSRAQVTRRAFELGSALGVGVTRGCSLYIGGVNINIYFRRWGRSFTYLVSY